jgi:hypothetical protein
MIGADVTLDDARHDLLCFLFGHCGTPKSLPPQWDVGKDSRGGSPARIGARFRP